MRRLWVRASAVWRALWRSDQLDAAMHEEMYFHIDMEAERLMREQGLECRKARRQARVAFGGVEKYKEQGRDTRARTDYTLTRGVGRQPDRHATFFARGSVVDPEGRHLTRFVSAS
jgi:hypothetical protein